MEQATSNQSQPRLDPLLMTAAGLLILCWFTPDAIADRLYFSWDRLHVTNPWQLAAVLAPPTGGALLLLAGIAPLQTRARAWFGRIAGIAILILTLLGPTPAVPLPGWILAICALALGSASVYLFHRDLLVSGHLMLTLLPSGLVGVWIFGITAGEPHGYVAALKSPVIIYAAMLAGAKPPGRLTRKLD